MELALIAAVAQNGIIGKDGRLPWTEKIKGDLPRFKGFTMGHPVIMGRKTYESFPETVRPLPGRANIVLTRNPDYPRDRIFVYFGLQTALGEIRERRILMDGIDFNTAYVIGGSSVYREALPFVDRLELTHVHKEVEGDVYFPESRREDSALIFSIEGVEHSFEETEREAHETHSFIMYRRR